MRILSNNNIQSNITIVIISHFCLVSQLALTVQGYTFPCSSSKFSRSADFDVNTHKYASTSNISFKSPSSSTSASPSRFSLQHHELFLTAGTSELFVNDLTQEGKSRTSDNNQLNVNNSVNSSQTSKEAKELMHPIKTKIVKTAMMSYITSMCIALPATLYPIKLLHRMKALNTLQKEQLSCRIGCFCSRWLLRLIPFASVNVMAHQDHNDDPYKKQKPEPSIWVCNHTSMLDIFFLLAHDKKLRGTNKRPIKIIYWKDLEKNPVTKLLFTMSGFIPVEMEANGNGNANTYKKSSFKALLKSIKQAFEDGFDIGILPEGQLNPTPEEGLQPIFSGAYTLAKMSKRPIKMMALHGLHNLWHGDDKIGMTVTGRKVKMRNYNIGGKSFRNGDEFVQAFQNVVGHFGSKGVDHPNWKEWLDGTAFTKNDKQ